MKTLYESFISFIEFDEYQPEGGQSRSGYGGQYEDSGYDYNGGGGGGGGGRGRSSRRSFGQEVWFLSSTIV